MIGVRRGNRLFSPIAATACESLAPGLVIPRVMPVYWLIGSGDLLQSLENVSIISVGSIETNEEEWIELKTGVWVILCRRLSHFALQLKNMEGSMYMGQLVGNTNPLAAVAAKRN